MVLDEAANIAPLAELDGLAATCAGHGVQLVTVWQDLAQVAARYGERAATVVNNHRAKVFLSGIADPRTLDHASHLVGDEELLVPSVTRDPARRPDRDHLAGTAPRCSRPKRSGGCRPGPASSSTARSRRSAWPCGRGSTTPRWRPGPGATGSASVRRGGGRAGG